MFRTGPLKATLALLALLALAGVPGSTSDLLMVAPFLLLVGLLIVGLYPGERIIEAVVNAVVARARTLPSLGIRLPRLDFVPARPAPMGASGSRGPPRPV